MNEILPTTIFPSEENFAISVYILENYARLTFTEATTYIRATYLWWEMDTIGKSRQAVYSLKKKAQKKIDACKEPVLDMIKPYVSKIEMIWID